MIELALNRKQVLQLAEIAKRFPDTEWYNIIEDNSNGVGPVVKVRCILLPDSCHGVYDTEIDITDITCW